MDGLFDDRAAVERAMPLAARLRPREFAEFVGQDEVTGERGILRRAAAQGDIPSLILWGPPGSGKTTLALLLARSVGARLVQVSAVSVGVAEIRGAVERARDELRQGRRTVLFIDEIHRFNKAQQDAVLPHVEAGTVRLIGATTENPSFSVNNALLSRCQVVRLEALAEEAMTRILDRALSDPEHGIGALRCDLAPDARAELIRLAGGDARTLLNALELAASAAAPDEDGVRRLDPELVREAYLHPALRHDRKGDLHYDIASAMIKSIRGSDADAAVYWLARLLEGGEDPMFAARRIAISAAEDIGLADPAALSIAVSALLMTEKIGMPEARLPLSEAVIYLALAPKSNSGLRAYGAAAEEVQRLPEAQVPLHLRNAPTRLMKDMGYGRGYRYAHDEPDAVAELRYLPEGVEGGFYEPTDRGVESSLRARWEELRRRIRGR